MSAQTSGDRALADIPFIALKEVLAYQAAGYQKLAELLDHLPKRYEDRRCFDHFPNQPTGSAVCLRGVVTDAKSRHFGPGRGYFEAVIAEGGEGVFDGGAISCRWFGMPFLSKVIAAGQELVIYGKVKELGQRLLIDHPEFEILGDDCDPETRSVHVERIVPIYRNIPAISQRRLRETMFHMLAELSPGSLENPLAAVAEEDRYARYASVHFPSSLAEAEGARRAFALDEFFVIQLNVAWRRQQHLNRRGRVLAKHMGLLTQFYQQLPFDLTAAQKRTIREIIGDMRQARPMNRLLQGDVGSGKTLVAIAAMLLAVDSGCQAALMAPTQILAEQHFLTLKRVLGSLEIRIALLTGNRDDASHAWAIGESPEILVGTHALLYGRGAAHDLGLVVIDEQHKFGVDQRAALVARGVTPDVLVMTATPIPRTLTMTLYGDLDVSVLDEKPFGRGKVITGVRIAPKQANVTAFLKGQLGAGRQAYLVYPLVEENERLNLESATTAQAKWQKRLAPYKVGLVHGRLRSEEKERVMESFRSGEIHALVATTVIEVGVDVPNASVMILHHAERFGLSQLHQLRGRIGRAEHKSWCILLTDGKNPEALEKLRVLEQTHDGFEVAEADLKLRGPGDVLGTMQSGLAEFRFVEFFADLALLREARAIADRVLHDDPSLTGKHRELRAQIVEAPPTAAQ